MLYKPTTEDVEKMNRTDLVFELSKHVHPDRYHDAIKMPTWALRRLLQFYKHTPKECKNYIELGGRKYALFQAMKQLFKDQAVVIGVDVGYMTEMRDFKYKPSQA